MITPQKRIEILARGNVQRKPSPDSVRTWKRRSETYRENYLRRHPNSVFKDIQVNTMSDRISNDPNNQAVKETAEQTLNDMGFKKKKSLKSVLPFLVGFMASKDRRDFARKGIDVSMKVLHRITGQDRAEIKADAKAVLSNARQKPSTILNSRKSKLLLVGLIGMGVCAGMLGTGLVSPSLVAFVGIKALDYSLGKVGDILSGTSIDEFLIGSVVASYLHSGDGGGFFSELKSKIKKTFKIEDDEDEEKPPVNDNAPDSAQNDNEDDEEADEDGADVALQRPSPQKIEAIKEIFEKYGVPLSIAPRPTEAGQLQRPVNVQVGEGAAAADVQKAFREAGLVSTKTLKPFAREGFDNSTFSAYLTK